MSDDATDDFEVVTPGGSDTPPENLPAAEGATVREPKLQRTVSDATRKAFMALAAKHAEGPLETETLAPVDTTPPAPRPEDELVPVALADPATPVAVPPPAHSPATGVAPIAVEQRASAADAAARAASEALKTKLEAREKELGEREKQIEDARSKLPTSDKLLDRPVATFKDYVKETLGLSDEEYKDFAADFITEYTSEALGAPVDGRVKDGIDARRAKLTVRTYTAEQKKRAEAMRAERAALDERAKTEREESERKAGEAKAQDALRGLITNNAAKYPYLMKNVDGVAPHEVVFEVLRNHRDEFVAQHGEGSASQFRPNWELAATQLNDLYKGKYNAIAKMIGELPEDARKDFATLLAPTPPAPARPSPQVSAQVPRSTTQTPTAKPQPAPTPTDAPVDWRAERAARRRKGLETAFSGATPEE